MCNGPHSIMTRAYSSWLIQVCHKSHSSWLISMCVLFYSIRVWPHKIESRHRFKEDLCIYSSWLIQVRHKSHSSWLVVSWRISPAMTVHVCDAMIFAYIVRDSFKYVTNHVVRDWLCRDAYHLRWLFMCVMQWSSFNYVVNQLVREYVVNHMVCKSFRNHTVRESLWFDANHLRRLFMCVTWFTHLDGFLTRPYVWRDKIICLQWYFSNVWQDSICFGRTRIE